MKLWVFTELISFCCYRMKADRMMTFQILFSTVVCVCEIGQVRLLLIMAHIWGRLGIGLILFHFHVTITTICTNLIPYYCHLQLYLLLYPPGMQEQIASNRIILLLPLRRPFIQWHLRHATVPHVEGFTSHRLLHKWMNHVPSLSTHSQAL